MRSILLSGVGFIVGIAALISAVMFLSGLVSMGNMIVPFVAGILSGLASAWHVARLLNRQNTLSVHAD